MHEVANEKQGVPGLITFCRHPCPYNFEDVYSFLHTLIYLGIEHC